MVRSKVEINHYISCAIHEARKAERKGEVPVGAIIVYRGEIIGKGHNTVISSNSVSCHAEINAINQASHFLKNYRLTNCDIFISLEPCFMCCMAIIQARLRNLYFALRQPKTGAVVSVDNFFDHFSHNHKVNYFETTESIESKELITNFFKNRR
jgi:tRNA(adenine34) deaminase